MPDYPIYSLIKKGRFRIYVEISVYSCIIFKKIDKFKSLFI